MVIILFKNIKILIGIVNRVIQIQVIKILNYYQTQKNVVIILLKNIKTQDGLVKEVLKNVIPQDHKEKSLNLQKKI